MMNAVKLINVNIQIIQINIQMIQIFKLIIFVIIIDVLGFMAADKRPKKNWTAKDIEEAKAIQQQKRLKHASEVKKQNKTIKIN